LIQPARGNSGAVLLKKENGKFLDMRLSFSILARSQKFLPQGLFGGKPGKTGQWIINERLKEGGKL